MLYLEQYLFCTSLSRTIELNMNKHEFVIIIVPQLAR